MNYVLEQDESLDEGLRRIVYEQVADAITRLEDPEDVHAAIHEARKDFKKIRAVLRLIRFSLGEDYYKKENIFYRDLGRELSDIRDAHVAGETLELLAERFSDLEDEQYLDKLKEKLHRRENDIITRDTEEDSALERVLKKLTKTRDRIEEWSFIPGHYTSLKNGMRKVYKRGYKGLDNSRANPRKDQFHEWRKRVKYLWYHHCILNPFWPKVLNGWADAIHDLSDYLGDEHDLSNLKEVIYESEIHELLGDKATGLSEYIQEYREELQYRSIGLGIKIYAEHPDNFIHRFEQYWKAEYDWD